MPRSSEDVTVECSCGLPLTPVALTQDGVVYECANRHRIVQSMPKDQRDRRLIQNWLDRRSGQLEEQHRRWEGEEALKRD